MAEYNRYGSQQHSPLMGEVPDSMESEMMRAWLGPEAKQQGLEPYQGVSRTHDHVDHLQVGRNLGHHVMTDMLQSNISIALLLPPQQVSPDLSYFEWTIEYANPAIAPNVTEEAPFPEITFATQPRYVKIERRGVAIRMTANIMLTMAGMARIRAQMMVLASTMMLTIEYLTMRAIVTAHDGPMFRRKMTLDRFSSREIEDRISFDAAGYASWNRVADINAANDMAEVDKLLRQYVAGPYAVLYPAGRAALLGGQVVDTGESLRVKAITSGKRVMEFETMPSTMRMGNGSLAFPVPDYSFGNTAAKEQPLLRPTMIGEHYTMTGINCNDIAYRTGVHLPGGGYSTCQRDIFLYDVTSNTYEKLSFEAAFAASGFVPPAAGRPDILDEFLGTAEGRQLTAQSFLGPNRAAPSRLYYDNAPLRVEYFGQFDENIIPAKVHRAVGDTIAACIHVAKGEGLSGALSNGIELVRQLAAAPFNRSIVDVLNDMLQDIAGVSTYRAQAPDLSAVYGHGGVAAYAQNADGSLQGVVADRLGELDTAINNYGVPPFMLSLGGLRFLARASQTNAFSGTAHELGRRAAQLLDAAEHIYTVLQEKFPDALAVNPDYRPVNFFPADGFATFFSSAFLNNANPPVLHRRQLPAEEGEMQDEVIVLTPFVWTRATLRSEDIGAFATGTFANPFMPVDNHQNVAAGTSLPRAHMRTPWEAQHASLAKATAARGFGGGRSASQRRSAPQLAAEEDEEEEDYFGITPTFRRGSGSRASRGAAVIGQPLLDEPGMYRDRELRGMGGGNRPGNHPLQNENARRNWDAADKISDALVRVCTLTYLTAPCNLMHHFERMMASDILVPFDIFVTRPVYENDMYSVAVMKPGIDTGANVMAGATMDFGIDVDHQTRKLTFALRHASIVKIPDHIALLPSRMARRYVAGGGMKLYHSVDEFSMQQGRPDLIAMVVPFGHKVNRYEPMGGINVDGVLHEAVGSARFPDARLYENRWRLSEQAMHTREISNSWEGETQKLPDYTWWGEQLNWNKERRHPAQGHRAGGSHPGCRETWDGIRSLFPDPPTGYMEW